MPSSPGVAKHLSMRSRAAWWRHARHAVGARRSGLLLLLVPLLGLPLLSSLSPPRVAATAYSLYVLAAFWALELLPIAVTALLPLVLFPLLGVMPATDVAVHYFQDKNVLFFGGLVIAAALETVRAHERIALSTLLLFGSRPRQLLLGFMIVTAFLSMWMNNTATCAVRRRLAKRRVKASRRGSRGRKGMWEARERSWRQAWGGFWRGREGSRGARLGRERKRRGSRVSLLALAHAGRCGRLASSNACVHQRRSDPPPPASPA